MRGLDWLQRCIHAWLTACCIGARVRSQGPGIRKLGTKVPVQEW